MGGTLLKEALIVTTEAAVCSILGQDVPGLVMYPNRIAASDPSNDSQIAKVLKLITHSFSILEQLLHAGHWGNKNKLRPAFKGSWSGGGDTYKQGGPGVAKAGAGCYGSKEDT